jgi:hypothetical protein
MLARLLCVFVSFAAATAHAQPPPARDRTLTSPPTGTAIIKGRVVDAQTGNGLARARVHLQGFTVAPPKTVVTDDTGAFILTEVVAGTLSLIVDRTGYMSAQYPEGGKTIRANRRSLTIAAGQVLEGVNIALSRGSAITGRVVDSHGEPAEYVNIQLLRIPPSGHGKPQQRGNAGTNDLGEFRIARLDAGSYVLRAQARTNMAGDDSSDAQPLPTYYPGVLSIDEAQPITIERGQTAAGIEIVLIDGTSSAIAGTVVDATGQPSPVGTYVNARPISELSDMIAGGAGVRADGSFRMKLAPGDYSLEVQAMRPGVIGRPNPGDQQFGRLRISVGSAPLSDLTIVLGPGATMSGTLVFEGDSPPPPNPEQIIVGVSPPPPSGGSCQSDRGSVAGGAFRVQGIVGTCLVRVMGNLGRWNVKSITQGDSDLMDRPVTFDPGQQLRNVRIVLTDKRTLLTLNVVDDGGRATREYVGLVFSTDKTKWSDLSGRYLQVYVPYLTVMDRPGAPLRGSADVRPAPTEQRDRISGLPPGDYYAVALTDIASDDTHDPAILERLAAVATRVSLTDRAPAEVSLRRTEPRD